jgi:ABC-type multidrug transport system ATPase subunit
MNKYLIDSIFKNFENQATIITILKDFDNVMKFDELVIMANGVIKEQGPPQDLLMNKDSELRAMVKDSNPKLERELTNRLRKYKLASNTKVLTSRNANNDIRQAIRNCRRKVTD